MLKYAAEGSRMPFGHRSLLRPGQGTRSLQQPRVVRLPHDLHTAWARLSATPASLERSIWHVIPWRAGDIVRGANKAPEKSQN